MRQKLLNHPDRPTAVDFDPARYILQIAHLVEIQVAHDPGVVDERIECRKLRERAFVQRRYCAGIANIALEGMGAGEHPAGGVESFLIAASNDYRVTSLVKLFCKIRIRNYISRIAQLITSGSCRVAKATHSS